MGNIVEIKKNEFKSKTQQLEEVQSFYQTISWAEFLKQGKKQDTIFLEIDDKHYCIVTFQEDRFGSIAYVPYGPLVSSLQKYEEIVRGIKSYLFSNYDLLGFEIDHNPYLGIDKSVFNTSELPQQPSKCWRIGLNKQLLNDEEEFFKKQNAEKDHRYYLRRSLRDGVKVEVTEDVSNFYADYESLMKFKDLPHKSKEYFENLLKYSGNLVTLFEAKVDEQVLASAVVATSGPEGCYLYGATSEDAGQEGAAYRLQAEIMKFLLKKEIHTYNMWGVKENVQKGESGYGYSQFKKGFGGTLDLRLPTEIVYNKTLKGWLHQLQSKRRKSKMEQLGFI